MVARHWLHLCRNLYQLVAESDCFTRHCKRSYINCVNFLCILFTFEFLLLNFYFLLFTFYFETLQSISVLSHTNLPSARHFQLLTPLFCSPHLISTLHRSISVIRHTSLHSVRLVHFFRTIIYVPPVK